MADENKPLSQRELAKVAREFRDKLPRTVDGRMYLKRGSQLYVETEPGSGKLELTKRNLKRYNTALGQITRGKLDPGIKARTEADSAKFEARRAAERGDGPKRGPGRPRKDGSPAQSKKTNTASSAADPVEKTGAAVKKTLKELDGPAKAKAKPLPAASKTQTRPIANKPSAPKSTRSGAANKPSTKGKAPSTPRTRVKPNAVGENIIRSIPKAIEDAVAKNKPAPKPKVPAKPKATQPKPQPAPKPAPKPKAESAPKPAVEAPKAPAKGKTPGKSSKASTTPSQAPKRPSSPRKTGQKRLTALDAAKAKIDADVKSGKVTKRQGQNAKNNLNTRKKTVVKSTRTAVKNQARGQAAKPAEVKPLTPAQKAAATRAANKAKAQLKRLPGTTFDEKLKNFKAAEPIKGSNNLVKIGGKVFRFAGKAIEPVAIGSMIYEKAQDPLGRKKIAEAKAWKKAHPNASLADATVASVKDVFGISDKPGRKPSGPRVGKAAPRNLSASDARAAAMSRAYASSKKPTGKGTSRSTAPMTGKAVRVVRGGTLWDIAQKNNTTVSALYKANPELAKRKAAGKTVIYSNTLVRVPRKK